MLCRPSEAWTTHSVAIAPAFPIGWSLRSWLRSWCLAACPAAPLGGRAEFGWLVRNRRLRANYEREVQTSETLIEIAIIRLLLRRHTAAA